MANQHDIIFQHVSFSFGDEIVLNNLSFNIKTGCHTLIKGESGSGKSTILKLLLGFYHPDEGRIRWKDNTIHPQEIRKQTAWLPQDLDLGSHSVSKVMEKPFEFSCNQKKATTEHQKIEILNQLGLPKNILDKPFRTLSTGQRQRVGIAICYLLDKPILLLDEPTSALDSKSKRHIANLLLSNKAKTIISTSHDPSWVKKADYIIEI
ncbi:ABC transporter ATP-binding protein [Fodinibius halophilus]|uniref:ATP-binding cassette domain-containing protein n=1 Tax=Fodinibius halophilus TaxID=1736908 RepID=A0A6M1TJQ1_9BACT|nr:ABC transporter ATP-binding protein [Fodinibius halophilus]NGP88830.1 ATP-binding cassette domain-containing protein [Fodinibius halophilus]